MILSVAVTVHSGLYVLSELQHFDNEKEENLLTEPAPPKWSKRLSGSESRVYRHLILTTSLLSAMNMCVIRASAARAEGLKTWL